MKKDISDLICTHQPFLHKRAISITKSREQALDLVQDTVLRILEQEAKFDRKQNFRTWSAQVMRNLYINQYNRRKRYRVFATETKEMVRLSRTVNNKGEENLGLEFLEKALFSLNKSHKNAFKLFFEGYNQKEIAHFFQIPLGTVKYHIFEAKRILKSKIKKENQLANWN